MTLLLSCLTGVVVIVEFEDLVKLRTCLTASIFGVTPEGVLFIGVREALPRKDGSGMADFCSVLLTVTAQLLSVSRTVVALIRDFFK